MTLAGLLAELRKWALSDEHLLRIVPLAQPRLETLSDWGFLTAFFFADRVPFDPETLAAEGEDFGGTGGNPPDGDLALRGAAGVHP